MTTRFYVADNEKYEGLTIRFVYDRKYKRFDTVQINSSQGWTTVKKVNDENFYVYFPGHAENLREANSRPRWSA